MSRLLWLLVLVGGLFPATSQVAQAQEAVQSWTPLFNGKDLKGWKTDPKQPGQWKVENGAIVGTGKAVSHLFSERGDFESFHLRVEAKISAKGNSGVYFRSEFGLSLRGTYPAGYEAQICPAGTEETQLTGSLYGLAPVRDQLVEPDQWFTLEVTGDGRFIDIKVNGKTAAHFKDEKNTYHKGHFALQQLPGTTVAFRRIDVLDPCPAQFRADVKETDVTIPLLLYWNAERQDNVTLSTPSSKTTVEKEKYTFTRIEGRILKEAKAGTVPLLLYWNADRKEYATVSTEAGKKSVEDAGYKLVATQGHVYKEQRPGTVPLNLWWNGDRKDYFTCSTKAGNDSAEGGGYKLTRVEGYVYDVWRNHSKPWAVILCKYSDTADYEPHPVRYYEEAFTAAGKGKGREFDYFREVSGGRIDMTGSKVFGWYTMPKISTADIKKTADRGAFHSWAVETAKAHGVDLTQFYSVLAIFNHPTDAGAFGANGQPMGVVLSYDKTDWNPNLNCHEIGHGFGLEHARLAGPLTEYGDGWDIMGSYFNLRVQTKFGDNGPGFNALHLKQLDCLSPDRIWTANSEPGSYTITLAALNQFDADGYLMASIPPTPGSKSRFSYWVEFRRKKGWDGGIPQDTILVHEDRNEWGTYLLSRKSSYDLDAMQVLPGQEFEVPQRDLTIKVESFDATASTAKVTIKIGNPGELSRKIPKEYLIVNVQSGRVLSGDPRNPVDDGADVTLFGKDGDGARNQRWQLVSVGKGEFAIANVWTGRVLDAFLPDIDKDGAKVTLSGGADDVKDIKEQTHRRWKIVNAGKGEIAIVNVKSGKLLHADPSTIDKNGTKITQNGTEWKDAPNRRWKLVEVLPVRRENLLVNGSFEGGLDLKGNGCLELKSGSTEITGWKVNNSVLLAGGIWQSADGKRNVLLQGEEKRGGIEQTFKTVKGQRYHVSFSLSANPNVGRWPPELTAASIEVSAAGKTQQFTFDSAGKTETNMGWVTKEWEFEATDDRTTLAFSVTKAKGFWHGPALDNVRVWPVNLLVNGSFEEGLDLKGNGSLELKSGSTEIAGWKVNNSVLLVGEMWQSADGKRNVLLQGEEKRGGIEQTFKTVKGQRYRVSFSLSANANSGRWPPELTSTSLEVSAAGKTKQFPFDTAGKSEACWVAREWEFEATADRTTLAFAVKEAKGFWHGPTLDDVRVVAVPGTKK